MATISSAPYVPIKGMINHQTKIEPANITKAYFRPTIYPSPSTAAPVLQENTNLNLSAKACPQEYAVVVTTSLQNPNVATI